MKKVLYIDDEADREKMASKFDILAEEGIRVIKVTSVTEAVSTFELNKAEIGVIILDILMPPEDYYSLEETNGGTTTGFRLLRDLRAVDSAIPVLIVSVCQISQEHPEVVKYHVAKVMKKPVPVADLIESIKEAMQAR